MRVLIDTHVWLWMWGEPEKIRNDARDVLEDSGTELVVSAASAWEISVKAAAGRLRLPVPPAAWLSDPRHRRDVSELPITFDHAARAGGLPEHHRDPFDRILAAQAMVEGLPLVTADPKLTSYEIEVIRA